MIKINNRTDQGGIHCQGSVPSVPGCFKTPTGTITVGGGEFSTPEAWTCCKGGMVEQYSAGLLGLGLGLGALSKFSRLWAKKR